MLETLAVAMERTPDRNTNSNYNRVLSFLESLRQVSKNLQSNSFFLANNPQSTLSSLSQLEHELLTILSRYDPKLLRFSQHLSTLRTQIQKLEKYQDRSFKSVLRRPVVNYKIYQLGLGIETEIQAYLDHDYVQCLVKTIQVADSEEEEVGVLKDFEKRVLQGFDSEFQELILKGKVFSVLESLLCDSTCSRRVRDHAALCIVALVKFNRDVFVGLVLMGQIIQDLISMASCVSIQVLCSLVRLIKTPLIDEIELDGEIPRIISLINVEKLSVCVAAMDCICEIAYHGRNEVLEAMLEQGLIEKLVELQRSAAHSENLIGSAEKCKNGGACNEGGKLEMKMGIEEIDPFRSCIARFAVQIEIGEGLSRKEKKEFKGEILRRVREAPVSEAEAATIIADVLWGSSP